MHWICKKQTYPFFLPKFYPRDFINGIYSPFYYMIRRIKMKYVRMYCNVKIKGEKM